MIRIPKLPLFLLLLAVLAAGGAYLVLSPSPPENHDEGEGHAEGDHVELTPQQIANANLTIEKAGPAAIRTVLHVNGSIGPNEERLMQVVPRFAGVVRAIHKRLGDSVRKGEPLVTIESNDSLRSYDIEAPIDGTVIARSAALGEFAGNDKSLFVIADLTAVWGSFSLYRSDFGKVRTGQTILVETGAEPAVAAISYVSPVAFAESQSTIVRAVLDNSDGRWRPGQFASANVVLSEETAAIAVQETALQTFEDRTVVFVKSGDGFEPRPVTLGAADGRMTEIRSGLAAGEEYVATNSFILKAELAKGSAEHSH